MGFETAGGDSLMETSGKVISVSGTKARVEVERKSACAGCHKAESGCAVFALTSNGGKMTAEAKNTAGARPGDTVRLAGRSRRLIFYAALIFILPVAAAAACYSAARFGFGWGEGASLASALGGFAAAFAGAAIYSRSVSRSGCDIEIIEIIESEKDENVQSR